MFALLGNPNRFLAAFRGQRRGEFGGVKRYHHRRGGFLRAHGLLQAQQPAAEPRPKADQEWPPHHHHMM